MKIIKPNKLKHGDAIGIVSPSAAILPKYKDQFGKGVKFLETLGYKVKVGKNVFNKYFYSAGTAQERADDLHDMFRDKEVQAIIQSQGGDTENEVLDYLDWKLIKANPKLFCGMSDGTVLALSIFAKTGLVTLHGPDVLWGYGRGCSDYEKNNLAKFLSTGEVGKVEPDPNHKVAPKSVNSSLKWKCWRKGIAEGKLIGGNLSVICRLHGTPYEPDYSGCILFLEHVYDSVEALANKFTYLKHAGILENVRGVILGYFDQNVMENADENRPVGEVFLEATSKYSFPVLEIGEIGHNTPNVNLPIGPKAEIDSEKLYFEVNEPGLK